MEICWAILDMMLSHIKEKPQLDILSYISDIGDTFDEE